MYEATMSASQAIDERFDSDLDSALDRARSALTGRQRADGHWCFEFEADCTIPSEYILMMHYMDEIDGVLQQKLARYIRAHQNDDGGWPLYWGGHTDLSCAVKAYFALKLAGDDPAAPHMQRARQAILERGGAERANVFTRITLAYFRQVPWRAVPFVPVEVMLLPRWFFFHIDKVSSWARTVMVPLFVLCSLRARAVNPTGLGIRELFRRDPDQVRDYMQIRVQTRGATVWGRLFLLLDSLGRWCEPLIPAAMRRRAVQAAEEWFTARLNGENGINGIFPAMANSYQALALLGYAPEHPYRVQARRALRLLVVEREDDAYCQPCVSPTWDTALALHALCECGVSTPSMHRSVDWLLERQITDEPGDWQVNHPGVPGGGWAFQYHNHFYPDLDDTAAVAWAIARVVAPDRPASMDRAADWLVAMQSKNDGFAAYDADNTHYHLNEIPFADHKALLDPPTADVTARVVAFLAYLGRTQDRPAIARAVNFLLREQEPNGSWFGRWGTNYVYGTWSVLAALELLGEERPREAITRAVQWLVSVQQEDGGWGESNDSYFDPALAGRGQPSTVMHTAWACLALMAAGEGNGKSYERSLHGMSHGISHGESLRRGIAWLVDHQDADGRWCDPYFNAPGFPRVFYLTYHGYRWYFPLWALARYRRLTGQ